MKSRVARVSLLLFGSGACALIDQTVWLRQFRLIFGASTLASAAVLAIFMGGLGVGGLLIGKRVDKSRNPLSMYGFLATSICRWADRSRWARSSRRSSDWCSRCWCSSCRRC